MFVLGIQGSPRQKGNSSTLLYHFLNAIEHLGADIEVIEVTGKKINPCLNCGNCEREGLCGINDDMQTIYPVLWKADIIVVATPVFFYSVPAQLKALIDRCQALWARKYIHKIFDPKHRWRKGYLLSVGATKGEKLFLGISLTVKYFFEAIGANYEGSLTFRGIEKSVEINQHPQALKEAQACAISLAGSLINRKKILFVGKENSSRSQLAQAFAQFYGGNKIEAESVGTNPGEKIKDQVMQIMKKRGIDLAFRQPKSFHQLSSLFRPDLIVFMENGDNLCS
ncbi:MAG: NAD(P)H-dependent oxidoreductase, partial [Desulfobacterota bacterium]|nr:NAD(P)H-dependent oxidoreductase [Thermodesulfobacteriota bacterium]